MSTNGPLVSSPTRGSHAPSVTAPTVDEGNASASASDGTTTVSLDTLNVGTQLPESVYNQTGTLLLAAGCVITKRFLARLRELGIHEVRVAPAPKNKVTRAEPRAAATPETKRLDSLLDKMGEMELELQQVRKPAPRLRLHQLQAEMERAEEVYDQTVERVEEVTADLSRDKSFSASAVDEVLDGLMGMAKLDGSLLPTAVRLRVPEGDYLAHHQVNVLMTSMAIAQQLALPSAAVRDVALGAMLQDVGMLQIPEEIRMAPRALGAAERAMIMQHPVHTLTLLEKVRGLSELSRLIAYQVHERGDRSGYPRKRHRMMIHPLARMVASVDAYSAMAPSRPYREAHAPYTAMERVLRDGAVGMFDQNAIRALLDCLSLFPLGSFVMLSDGHVAKVLRATPGAHTQPVVQPLSADGVELDVEIDLIRDQHLWIVKALGGPGGAEPA